MRPNHIKSFIRDRFKNNIKRTVLIEGSPGIGKTQIVEQLAKELELDFKVIHAPLLQPEDYGFPVIHREKNTVDFVVSKDKFPIEGSSCGDTGIFLIDELSQCGQSEQKILANLVQAKEIHGHKIKKGWMIVATGNRVSDRSGAVRILGHLGNRVTRVTLEPSLDDWCSWALDNNIAPEVIAFIRFRPDLLNNFDSKLDINPTPRAWAEGVNPVIGNIEKELEFECFKGDIGEGPAAEFSAFLKICRELPSIDVIMMDPKKAEIPKKQDVMYAVTAALANKVNKDNFARVMEYIMRLPKEFSVMFVKDAIKRHKEIQTTKEFTQWISTVGSKLMI